MKLAHLMALAIFLSSCVFASQLAVTVTATQDTLLPMTNVSVVSDGVILSTEKTGSDGIARFSLADGSYFVLLPRTSIYPPFVALVDVRGDTGIKMTKHICSGFCTSSAYGQISGPQSFHNTSVIAFSNGAVVKRASANSEGLYMLPYVQEGNYELLFESPGFEQKRLQVFLPASDFIEVNAQLEPVALPPEQNATLSTSPQVQQYSVIEVVLAKGGPLSGKTVIVATPSGQVRLTTDSSGKAYINAAEPGAYSFTYAEGGITATSSSEVVGSAPPKNTTAIPPAEQPPSEQPQAVDSQALSSLAIGGIAAFALLAVAAMIAAIALLAKAASDKNAGHAKQGHADANEGQKHPPHHRKTAHKK